MSGWLTNVGGRAAGACMLPRPDGMFFIARQHQQPDLRVAARRFD